jgi:hypothetical protein
MLDPPRALEWTAILERLEAQKNSAAFPSAAEV